MDPTIGSIIELIIFVILALVSIVFAVFVVTAKDVVRAAIALVVTMFIVAAFYIMLNAQFLGVAQVLVYIGAVGVLILFAVMLTKKEFGTDAE
ncbi:MAG: dehydrogenase subunit [Methanolobus sp.]|jgi:NADH-quinone oxidoreductase subunit J|uniref:NADH:ubiquinone oxidoreductase subunit 6 (Chain J) n=1 Tax=Methanolobus tindarius DSM 2278 TaxID=1090322 RepID=W9DPP1_METTI|nr:NADH-quinone oxidoreductase subunit J [Methanolobus tindarius]ETA67248.1 NADH:ubiquinone oxidoreductase subunit 6 (chain J) [Methanolobus tindarius DSM 2278]MDK2939699.1 dehydrogenase subunit [Methanolobus sp.]